MSVGFYYLFEPTEWDFDVQYSDELFGIFGFLRDAEEPEQERCSHRTRRRGTRGRPPRGARMGVKLFGERTTFHFSPPRFTENSDGWQGRRQFALSERPERYRVRPRPEQTAV